MIEIRFRGRGGQGVFGLAKNLAEAVLSEDRYVQAIPSFSREITSAPFDSYLRASDEFIHLKNNVYNPDHMLVLDENLLEDSVVSSVKDDGWILVVSEMSPEKLMQARKIEHPKLATINATKISNDYNKDSNFQSYGNLIALSALIKITNICDLKSLMTVVNDDQIKDLLQFAYENVESLSAG